MAVYNLSQFSSYILFHTLVSTPLRKLFRYFPIVGLSFVSASICAGSV